MGDGVGEACRSQDCLFLGSPLPSLILLFICSTWCMSILSPFWSFEIRACSTTHKSWTHAMDSIEMNHFVRDNTFALNSFSRTLSCTCVLSEKKDIWEEKSWLYLSNAFNISWCRYGCRPWCVSVYRKPLTRMVAIATWRWCTIDCIETNHFRKKLNGVCITHCEWFIVFFRPIFFIICHKKHHVTFKVKCVWLIPSVKLLLYHLEPGFQFLLPVVHLFKRH